MQDFKRLHVWQDSLELARAIYQLTQEFPASERYVLATQIRRTAISISSNIAEGCGRLGGADTRRFFQIAIGSTSELESQLLLAREVGLTSDPSAVLEQADRVRRKLIRLTSRVHDS